ncbi:MarR family winged helix-turn-helix transcriptional regulator [Pseudalkalibacillus decolorationis]|uniref:MarR family winged helix-turn-helix transcriptional regulator n=1 Tax=Pseudalkalibacillus decolorationis TaxID=163879 RepID=UPI00214920CC|nr:MarR family transcriptional regulator [Pseudalkalibacillus decolorationis]
MNSRLNQNFDSNGYPVTYEQWQILSRLYEEDGQTQNQIALLIERDQASVSRLIDNMVKRQLVKRVPHPHDRRIKHIFLTEESKHMQRELEELALKTISKASDHIHQEDLETCLRVLDQIRKNFK